MDDGRQTHPSRPLRWLSRLVSRQPQANVEGLLAAWSEQAVDYALILTDAQGMVLGMSRGTQQILGYDAVDLLGKPLATIFTPEDVERGLVEHERRVAMSVCFSEDDRWHVRKDRSRIWAGGSMRALRDAEGRCIGFAKVLRDRSDLRMLITTLENRTAALADADQRKVVFLTQFAHELANAVQPVSNGISILAGRVRSADDARLFAMVSRQLQLIRRFTQDLRDMAGIESGKLHLNLQTMELGRALEEAFEASRPGADLHGVTLELLAPAATIHFAADPARLQQILSNLLTNAIKYTQRGGHVWLKGTVEGESVVIRVEDNGIGIGPDMLPRAGRAWRA